MKSVQVFKTNITDCSSAETVLDYIRKRIPDIDPSFDLEDRDKVLRVEKPRGRIDKRKIINIIKEHGYEIESLL